MILKRSISAGLLILLSVVGGSILYASPSDNNLWTTGQIQSAVIRVNGRTLSGPNSAARVQNGHIQVPISAIARALGDDVTVNSESRKVSVRRQNGVLAELDGVMGLVTEDGSTVLAVSNTGQLNIPLNTNDLFLPAEIFAALFDASLTYDSVRKEVVIYRGQATAAQNSQTKVVGALVELKALDFEYNLNRYSSSVTHGLILRGAGRIADGRFTFTSNASRHDKGLAFQNSSFHLERPSGQRFSAGDLGTGGKLSFLASTVRGVSASIPVGDSSITVFGGRTFSGDIPSVDGDVSVRSRYLRYDTNVYGITAEKIVNPAMSITAGGLRFSSLSRSGTVATGAVRYGGDRVRLDGDLAFGAFRVHPEQHQTSGNTAAIDLAGTYQILDNLSVQGRYTSIGRRYLSPQSGVREPLNLKAASINWTPVGWLSASVNASTSRRPDNRQQNNDFVTAAFALTPSTNAPRFFVSHTQGRTSQIRRSEFTTVNASKDFSRLRLYLNATRIKNFGTASVNANFGASFTVNDTNSIEVSQGFGSRRSNNGQIDWRGTNLFRKQLNLAAGLGYNYSPSSGFSPYQRLAAGLTLPKQMSLQLNYYNTNQGAALMISVRGSLLRKRELQAFLGSSINEMNSYGKVSGRVYQDLNLNGHFDVGVDKPQADVKVRIDGNRYVVTDPDGSYSFDSITAGEHGVYLDLSSLRADLTLLDEAVDTTNLRAGNESVHDFRLVRTGRISGRVWLDANENGVFDEGEKPLADIRVATASGRDTLTDADGVFVIGDLAPGEHIFFIDEKTLPEKMVAGKKPIAVQAFAGRETSDVLLPVISAPAEIVRFPNRQP